MKKFFISFVSIVLACSLALIGIRLYFGSFKSFYQFLKDKTSSSEKSEGFKYPVTFALVPEGVDCSLEEIESQEYYLKWDYDNLTKEKTFNSNHFDETSDSGVPFKNFTSLLFVNGEKKYTYNVTLSFDKDFMIDFLCYADKQVDFISDDACIRTFYFSEKSMSEKYFPICENFLYFGTAMFGSTSGSVMGMYSLVSSAKGYFNYSYDGKTIFSLSFICYIDGEKYSNSFDFNVTSDYISKCTFNRE